MLPHGMNDARYCPLALLLIVLMVGCSESATAPSAGGTTSTTTVASGLSLTPAAWETISVPATFPLRNDAAGALVFDFPTSGSINYLYNVRAPKQIAGTLAMSVRITTSGPVVFDYMTESFNTCVSPATVRLLIWANRDGFGDYDRWWSNPSALTLAPGASTLNVPLTPDQWSNVNGAMGNANEAARAGFDGALRNVSSLGMTFGGGCFFGHGVTVRGGTAQLAITSYQVQ